MPTERLNEREAILVNGYAYPSVSPEVLEAWLPQLTFLSTFSYGLTPEGELIMLENEELVRAANEAGVAPLMVLTPLNEEGQFSNEIAKQVMENPEAQDRFISEILKVLEEKEMLGVDFDFEYVYAANAQDYVNFVNRTREALNARGYLVNVALAPKTSAEQIGLLYEGHDYAGMGRAANFVLLMTYEWGYTFGPPLAVAPLAAVRRVLDYGVSVIPAEKLLMGIPNYGYDWTLPYIQGSSRAEKLAPDEAAARAARYGATIEFDEEAQSPYYYYTDIDGRQHVVWFEDERSWAAKFELVREYGLAGVSFWNIMDYSPAASEALASAFDVAKINELIAPARY